MALIKEKWLAYLTVILVSFVLGHVAQHVMAQNAAPPAPSPADACKAPPPNSKYPPTEVQCLRLRVLQDAALLAQQQMMNLQQQLQTAQSTFQQRLQELTDASKQIKADNHWPPDIIFNPNDNTFTDPPPPAPPSPPPAKEPKKP
jgi:hypothetical protein